MPVLPVATRDCWTCLTHFLSFAAGVDLTWAVVDWKMTIAEERKQCYFSFTNNFSCSLFFVHVIKFWPQHVVITIKKSLHNTENRTCTIWKCFSVNYEVVLQTTSSSWQQVKNCLVHLQEYMALLCSCGAVSLPSCEIPTHAKHAFSVFLGSWSEHESSPTTRQAETVTDTDSQNQTKIQLLTFE